MIAEKLLAAVDGAKGRPLAARQLSAAAGLHPGEHTNAKRVLRELVREGVLVREGKRFRRPDGPAREAAGRHPVGSGTRAREALEITRRKAASLSDFAPGASSACAPAPALEPCDRGYQRCGDHEVVGVLTRRPEGFGFVKRLSGPPGEDVFLPPPETRYALDGDTVRIELVPGKYGRDAGRLIEVVDRRRRHVVGTYRTNGRDVYVEPVDPTLPRLLPVPRFRGARDGQAVKVALTAYPGPGSALTGEVVRVVGEPGDPLVEVLSVAYAAGFAEDFPAPVRKAAEKVPAEVSPADTAGRRDLRELPLVTIDGEDARDFDDAVLVEKTGSGFRLVVAIADVAHYVREGAPLDEEALQRATSVYFPNHVLPMLPERLSNGICSLNPDVDRLCMVCDLSLDAAGVPVKAELYEGVMRSHARCTYTQVARLLGGELVPELDHVARHLRVAGTLATKLQARRAERGALEFDLPEAKVVLDEHMVPIAVARQERNDAHRLIEEFMLAANEAVARHFDTLDLPTVYRVHGTPDPEKLETFATLARAQGLNLDVTEGLSSKDLNAFLRQLEGSPHKRALNSLLLRAMMQAVYSPENIGHFGLAATHYLHFTSPIRRYPDLMVHRLLKRSWARGREPGVGAREWTAERLDEVAAISSERERAAAEAERDIDAYFKCLFVQDRVGERFQATVVAVTDFGFFAELDGTAVEGLVRADSLGASWDLDPDTYRLTFGSGVSFGIGDRVEVEIASVNPVARRIELTLVEAIERAAPPKPKKGRARRAIAAEAPALAVFAPWLPKLRRPAAASGRGKVVSKRPEPAAAKRRAANERGRQKLGVEPTAAKLPPRQRPIRATNAVADSSRSWQVAPEKARSPGRRGATATGGRRTRTGVGAQESGGGRGMPRMAAADSGRPKAKESGRPPPRAAGKGSLHGTAKTPGVRGEVKRSSGRGNKQGRRR